MKRLIVCALLCATSARADTLTIDLCNVSYYFTGSGLIVEGESVSMTATALAIGDHPGDTIGKFGFDAPSWAWYVSLNGTEIDGHGACTMAGAAPSVRLSCEP